MHWSINRILSALLSLRVVFAIAAMAVGFMHISDDDYARTVIAQTFALTPKLDPSGTSWLPAPFWITGTIMRGVTLAPWIARFVTLGLTLLATTLLWDTARKRIGDRAAAIGVLSASLLPWSVWTSIASPPEGFAMLLLAAAVFDLGNDRPSPIVSMGLLLATLSRYESWFLVPIYSVRFLFAGPLSMTRSRILALLPAMGPLFWLAVNRVYHGDALHFIARVSRFHERASASSSLSERGLSPYFEALVNLSLLVIPSAMALAIVSVWKRQWRMELFSVFFVVLALAVSGASHGAPTHHFERIVLFVPWVLFPLAAACLAPLLKRLRFARASWGLALLPVLVFFQGVREVKQFPGQGGDNRDEALALGDSLRDTRGHFQITPCAYEHFATIAAARKPGAFEVTPPNATSPSCPTRPTLLVRDR